METLWQDLKYGARMLIKRPGFTAVAVLTLALGIGANTAIFSVIEAVLLRPLPYREPDRLMFVWEQNFERGRKTNVAGPANYIRWRERNQSFEQLPAYSVWSGNITGLAEPERIPIGVVTGDFFQTLGAQAALGRVILPSDALPNSPDVVVLSHDYWAHRFGADPNAVGRTVNVNSRPRMIIGVMPAGFRGLMVVDLWVPLAVREEWRNFRGRWMVVLGRLKPGVTRDQAQAEMAGIAKQIETELPDFTGGWGVNVVPMREQLVGDVRQALLVLLGAVGFVLLIACGNVANLMLARANDRKREFAVRVAVGAPRWRIARQLLTESTLLGLLGGGAGLLLGVWAVSGLQMILPPDLARFTEVSVNPALFAFAFGLALLTGILFGMGPALAASRSVLSETLKEGGRGGVGSARSRLRGVLVVAEVTLSVVLLVGAGLMLRSFARLQNVNPGFQPENLVSFQLSLSGQAYREHPRVVQFFDRLLEGVGRLPGVRSAGAISWLPFAGPGSATSFKLPDHPVPPAGQEPVADVRIVTPTLFATMGIPLQRGRALTAQDTAKSPPVVVINEALARQYWPGQDPVGKRLFMSWGEDLPAEVVGVVGDVRLTRLDTEPRPTIYWSLAQLPNDFMTVMVRSEMDPAQLIGALKKEVAALDPDLPAARIQTLETVMADSLNQPRFTALLLGLFAGVALLLAAVGIYGMLAYSVTQRTHEIGIRVALGAQAGDVISLVMKQGAGLVLAGLGLGLAGALALSQFLQELLFDIRPTDLTSFGLGAALLAGVALVACWIPARRATRVDPIIALRYE